MQFDHIQVAAGYQKGVSSLLARRTQHHLGRWLRRWNLRHRAVFWRVHPSSEHHQNSD
jgi:hypothetical protein